MIKSVAFRKLVFLCFFLGFLMLGQSVLANECLDGQAQPCGTCGIQKCECHDETVGSITVNVCDWGSCDEAGDKPDNKETKYWHQFRCQGSSCGKQYIQEQECSSYRTRSVSCQSGEWKTGSWGSWSDPYCSVPFVREQCDLGWQLCSGSTSWSQTQPSCDCAKECLEAPENPRYYNNPDYPVNPYQPEESEDADNIFLPVKLDWDNIKGWRDGWKESGEVKECIEDCVQSYSIRIDNTSQASFSKALTDSEYNPTADQGACFLKSDATHNWKVSACCNADGTECGPESNWSFSTNSAPELISPVDPDWNHPELAQDVPLPISLKWCKLEIIEEKEVLSYGITPYLIENGNAVCHPARQSGTECLPLLVINTTQSSSQIEYIDENMNLFTKLTSYAWQVAACRGGFGGQCGESSQVWQFKTGETTLDDVTLISPANNDIVGLPVTLDWSSPPGANSFQYELYEGSSKIGSGTPAPPSDSSISFENLKTNTEYKWRIMPCKDFEGKICENWSEEWTFKTTGMSPEIMYPKSGSKNIPIPIQLGWQSVSGAKSYKYWLFDAGKNLIANNVVKETKSIIEYDSVSEKIRQESSYYWQVATCIDAEGKICGERSGLQEFTTFLLSAPLDLSPENKAVVYTYQLPVNLSWDSDAKYFKITIKYTEKSPEESKNCPLESNSYNLEDGFYPFNFDCLGKYTWQVRACLDKDCSEKGDSAASELSLEQTVPPGSFGLIPCGRSSDDPNTPWNERESCQIKHLFILFRNILDFLLWRVSLIVLLLLTVATAGIYYVSIGRTDIIIDVKELWRSAGKGFAIIFLAWMFVSLFLNFLGYRVGIFGNWWQIKL